MAGIEMVRRGNFHIRDCVAAIRERDPKKCWAFQSLIDYDDFKRLPERTREPSKVESIRKRKRKDIESKNSAGNAKNINSNLTFDVEEYSDDVTIGEFLRKQRTLKVKKKQVAVEFEEQRLVVVKPSPVGSFSGLTGLKSLGSVSRVHESMVGVGGAKKKQKTLEVEGARLFGDNKKQKALEGKELRCFVAKPLPGGSNSGLGLLKPSGSVSWAHELVVGVGGVKKKQMALKLEEPRLSVGKPSPAGSCGGQGGLSPHGSLTRVHEPVVEVGGDKKKQMAKEIEEAILVVAKPSLAGSSVRLGGLKAPGSVSRVHEPSSVHERVVGVGGAKNKQKVVNVEEPRLFEAKPSPTGSYVRLGGLKPPGSMSRVQEPVVGDGGAKNKQKVSDSVEPILFMANGLNPWNLKVLACSINKNPAEFSTQTAKKFMRRIMS